MAKGMKFNQEMLQKALLRKVFNWVDGVMRDELPPDIYSSAHLGNLTDRGRAMAWLNEKGYRVVTYPDGVAQVWRGTKLIRSTRLVLELTDPEELLQIAENVHKHMNIPAPPWAKEVKQ